MVRAQGLGAAVVLLLVVLLGAGCSPETPSDLCGGGRGERSVDGVVLVLIESASDNSVDSVCQLFETQRDRAEVETSLEALRVAVEGEGGFGSVKIAEKEQFGSEHVLLISAPDGKSIREFSVFSTHGGKRFFLGTL